MPWIPFDSAPDDPAGHPVEPPPIAFAMLSDKGRVRNGNEDVCAASPDAGIFVVCDGMGGAAAGEVASQLAAQAFLDHLKAPASSTAMDAEARLQAAVDAANSVVFYRSRQHPGMRGMGTTLVALTIFPRLGLWLTHVGDSRCYRMRDHELRRLTRDHSYVEEQILAGQLTEAQAERSPLRNIITRAVGASREISPEIAALDARPGDLYLLASDGLTRELADTDLAIHLAAAGPDLDAACHTLVDAANAAGGQDNITVLLLRMLA